jgi:ankyrin repeat protein
MIQYCFFDQKLGMTFKIHNGSVTLDSVDKFIFEGSTGKRKSHRKSDRFSVIAELHPEDEGTQFEKEIFVETDDEEDSTDDHDKFDGILSDTNTVPSTPIAPSGYISSDISVATSNLQFTSSSSVLLAPSPTDNISNLSSNAPVVSNLEYSGIAYGTIDYSGADSIETDATSADVQKILVESELLFGHNIKKLVKLPFAKITMKRLAEATKDSCQLSQSIDQLLFTFHDPDVDDFVVLDDYSLQDFLKLSKKVLQVQEVAPPPPTPQSPNAVKLELKLEAVEEETQRVSIGEVDTSMTVPTKLPPPPPSPPPPLDSHSSVLANTETDNADLGISLPIIPVAEHLTRRLLNNGPLEFFNSFMLPENGGFVSIALGFIECNNNKEEKNSEILRPVCSESDSNSWKVVSDFPKVGSRVRSLNGVYIDDLDRGQQISLLKQRSRPFIFEFEVWDSSNDIPINNSRSNNSTSSSTIKYSLFWSKYSSGYASKLRKQIDKILDDYHSCDWEEAKKMGTGLPQTTVISLYKYIEQELVRLYLLDPKRSRGGGMPLEMTENHWQSIRGHIESMIFKRIVAITKSNLWPIFKESVEYDENEDHSDSVQNFHINKKFEIPPLHRQFILPHQKSDEQANTPAESLDNCSPEHEHPLATSSWSDPTYEDYRNSKLHVELSHELSLNVKLAFLRFVTLEILGVEAGTSSGDSSGHQRGSEEAATIADESDRREIKFPSELLTVMRILNERNRTVFQEEWYQAIRGLHQINQMETPGEMMHRLKLVVDLITRALEKHINCPSSQMWKNLNNGSDLMIHHHHHSHQGHSLICGNCKKVHITTAENEAICLPSSLTSSSFADWKNTYGRIHAASSIENGGNSSEAVSSSRKQITGDDLLPGIVFALIQANPTGIECLLWLCAEFRHPSLNMGEEAYCLASVSSALEFVRRATYKSFDVIPRQLYDHFLLRYAKSLKLMLACKQGDLELVRSLVEEGADVNALSPDQIDTPLTACIRFGQNEIFHYLLLEQQFMKVAVDTVVALYRGPHERSTALHIAVHQGEIMMTLMLLDAGANRYLVDEEGRTPLSIAMAKERESQESHSVEDSTGIGSRSRLAYTAPHSILHTILLADIFRIDIVDMILRKDPLTERLLAGLVLQGVDVHRYHSRHHCAVQCSTAMQQQMHALITPLIAAVLTENIPVLKMLLSIPFCTNVNKAATYFGEFVNPVNKTNAVGESALLVCVEKCMVSPSESLLAIAAILLRAQADRYLMDSMGRSAVNAFESISSSTHDAQSSSVFMGHNHQATSASMKPLTSEESVESSSTSGSSFPFPSGALAFYRDTYPEICFPSTGLDHNSERDHHVKVSYAFATSSHHMEDDGFNIVPHLFPAMETPMSSTPELVLQKCLMHNEDIISFLQSLILQDPARATASPIYEFARHHDFASVRGLLLQAVDINASCPKKGYSALISSVYNRDVNMLQLILNSSSIAVATCPLSEIWTSIFFDVIKAYAVLSMGNDETVSLPSLKSFFPKMYTFTNPLKLDQPGRGDMTALHYAAQLGLTTIVGLLLAHGANRATINAQHHAAVDIAVANGHMDTANVLRFDPARVSICLASKHGDWLVMKALLLQGVDINIIKEHYHAGKDRRYELDTPLIAAASHGQYDLVKRLLTELSTYAGKEEHDAEMVMFHYTVDVNLVNSIGQSALICAATRGEENLVLLLLKYGADRYIRDHSGHDAVHWAVTQGHHSIAVILRHDPDLIFVHDLIRKNDFEAVVAMFKQGVDVNLRREKLFVSNALVFSEEIDGSHHHGTATSVLTSSTSSDAVGSRPVYHRRLSTATAVRLESLQEFARMFIPGETPLIVAARYARMDIMHLLFKAPDVHIDAVDDTNGWTALFYAAEQGHENVVKFLLGKRANRKIEDCLGRCARDIALLNQHDVIAAMIDADPVLVHIHDACQHGLLMLTIGLLKQGCPPTYRDERPGMQKQTPLMAAATGGQVDIIRMLLRYPAVYEGKDDRDAQGRTALMRAAAVGNLDATAALLNAGCDRNLQDQQGLTARDHAARHSFTSMFQYMSQSMVR